MKPRNSIAVFFNMRPRQRKQYAARVGLRLGSM